MRAAPADSAPARVIILGQTDTAPPPSCPGRTVGKVEVVPCRVEGHVSGFQVMAGGVPDPYVVPFDGKIVAWSLALSRPSREDSANTTDEVGFFNGFLGSPSQARIGVLRRLEDSKPPRYKLVRQSPLVTLNPYFGSTPVFALEHPLTVLRDQVVALTVPTWAPMFAFNVAESNTWRGSRAARPLRLQRRHPGRPPAAGRRQGQDLWLLLLRRPAALHGDDRQRTLSPELRAPLGEARSRGSR